MTQTRALVTLVCAVLAAALLALFNRGASGPQAPAIAMPVPLAHTPATPFPAPAVPVTPITPMAPVTQSSPPALSLYEVEKQVHALRARGASDNEIYRVRAQALTARTVAELEEREQAEAAWLRRMDAFRAERERLGLVDDASLASLRARHFNQVEQARLAAYEKPAVPTLQH